MATRTDWAWLAGLLDGEGCITINRQRARNRKDLKTDSFRLYVQITMGHKLALNRCKAISGVGSIQPHTVSKKNANPAFCWMVSARDAQRILRNVLPYLAVKRAEAELAMDFCSNKPWLRPTRSGNTQKPQWLVDNLLTAYWKLRALKPRWRFYRRSLHKADRAELRRLGLAI